MRLALVVSEGVSSAVSSLMDDSSAFWLVISNSASAPVPRNGISIAAKSGDKGLHSTVSSVVNVNDGDLVADCLVALSPSTMILAELHGNPRSFGRNRHGMGGVLIIEDWSLLCEAERLVASSFSLLFTDGKNMAGYLSWLRKTYTPSVARAKMLAAFSGQGALVDAVYFSSAILSRRATGGIGNYRAQRLAAQLASSGGDSPLSEMEVRLVTSGGNLADKQIGRWITRKLIHDLMVSNPAIDDACDAAEPRYVLDPDRYAAWLGTRFPGEKRLM